MSRRRRSTPIAVFAILAILGGFAISGLVYYVAKPDTPGESTEPVGPAALSRNETCAVEVIAAAAVLYADPNGGVLELNTAIGLQSATFVLAMHLQVDIQTEITRAGLAEARPAIADAARRLCANKGDPLLTAAQVESLMAIVHPNDAATLSRVTLFG